MKHLILPVFILLLAGTLGAQFGDPFMLRHSSVCPDGSLRLRWEGTELVQCHYSINGAAWQMAESEQLNISTQQALIPYQFGQTLKYRLHGSGELQGESYAFMHVPRLDSDAFPPALNQLGQIATDAVGDSVTLYAPMLDLTEAWVGVSDARIHTALANHSGSFPTMNSLTSYNIYLTLIANPDVITDSLTYAMVYSNIPIVLPSGLYKIGYDAASGLPTFDNIGSIQSQVSGGKLFTACNLADLTGDPDFGPWPSLINSLVFGSATIRATIDLSSGDPSFGFGDYGGFGLVFFADHRYQVASNALPQCQNISLDPETNLLSFNYFDPNGDFPLSIVFNVPGGESIEPLPTSLDYSQPVLYTASLSSFPAAGTITVTDNNVDFVDWPYDSTDAQDGLIPTSRLACQLPNPLRYGAAPFELKLSGLKSESLRIDVFNLRGQNLGAIADRPVQGGNLSLAWDGRVNGQRLPGGVYLLRVAQPGSARHYKLAVMN